MIYIAGFILVFTLLQLIVTAVNLIFRQNLSQKTEQINAFVSILIPVRDEEKNIGNLLSDLLKQNHQNIEILIFNDQSTDNSTSIINGFKEKDNRIKLFHSKGLPVSWLGKNYACYSLSKEAKGEYFIFLDADVRLKGDIISQTVKFAQKFNLGLFSIFPKQVMKSFGEYITVPNMNFILLSLLPLILVRKSGFYSLSAANGQFMLFNRAVYNKTNPHKLMKSEKVEDIKIAQYFKKKNIPVACTAGTENISCRMYSNYKEALNGFSKNVVMFFGNSIALTILFWIITTLGFLAVYVAFSLPVFIVYIIMLISIRIFVSITSNQHILKNLILAIPQQLTLGAIIYKAIVNIKNKNFEWKGRSIS